MNSFQLSIVSVALRQAATTSSAMRFLIQTNILLRFAPVSGWLGTETCEGVVVAGQGSSSYAVNANRLYIIAKVIYS